MIVGAMNHPGKSILEEIEWMSSLGLDFIDLTLEPPRAAPWMVAPKEIKSAIDAVGFKVVGHTAFYLPIAHPFEPVRKASVNELKKCLPIFVELGAEWVNVHPDRHAPFEGRDALNKRNAESINDLLEEARKFGIGIMIENIPGGFNRVNELEGLLEELPELGLHLDIGHCNLMVEKNSTSEILERFGDRLRHVHIHDNKGGHMDLHLPLGAGNMDFETHLRSLKICGYDGTITLEVFSEDRSYLQYSRDLLVKMWDSFEAGHSRESTIESAQAR